MRQIGISVDDTHASLYEALRAEGVKPREVLESGIRLQAEALGYTVEYIPAKVIVSRNGKTHTESEK